MKKHHEIEKVEFEGEFMTLVANGRTYRFQIPAISERLAQASEAQRRFYRISPSGYGIHWPEIDEDLSVDALLESAKTYKIDSTTPVLREGDQNPNENIK